jgi:RNA 2',3'-cyclic 3'-phosphodiesterase
VHRSPTARLFVAVDPPRDVREQLAAWTRAALRETSRRSGDSQPRVLDAELLHVTLCFLGNRPTGEIAKIGARLAACAGPAGELSVGAPLWLPPRRPRTLAVELHDEQGKLASLQKSVAEALAELAELGDRPHNAEGRPNRPAKHRHFRPHVTVARMRSGAADGRSKGAPIDPHERALPPTPALRFVPRELVLYRSWLSPEGATYEALASHPIG